MAHIQRSRGITNSERNLAELADRTFLSLWSYPNVYRDVMVNGKRAGKELCDLLIVCGSQVIIFSDKKVKWSESKDVKTAWARWYKKAVTKSVDQVCGAARWIEQFPERIYLDQACTIPLPIKIQPKESRKVHTVVVLSGVEEIIDKLLEEGLEKLTPIPANRELNTATITEYMPFTISDTNPGGAFVHVLGDAILDVLLTELDTITDFTTYLERKAIFARSRTFSYMMKEDDLLAYYLINKVDGKNAFPEIADHDPKGLYMLEQGYYTNLTKHPSYIRTKSEYKISYLWDDLIQRIANKMLAGSMRAVDGIFDINLHQTGLQLMAAEPRSMRRIFSQCIAELWSRSYNRTNSVRAMFPDYSKGSQGTAYLYMIYGDMQDASVAAYVQYRKRRVEVLEMYCVEILRRNPEIKQIVGIATEPSQLPVGFDRSEDLIAMEQLDWTADSDLLVKNAFEQTGIKFTTGKMGDAGSILSD